MKKRILAFVCALVLMLSAVPAAGALAGEELRAADTLYTLGLVQNSDYELDRPATRAQAVALTVRLAGAETAAKADRWISGFLDVPAWVETEVNYAAHQGWVSGVTAIRFAPDQTVTANGYCAFLLRMLGYSDKAGDFTAAEAAAFARHIGLTDIAYDGGLTRGDLFAISVSALSFRYKGSTERVIDRLVSAGAVSRAAAGALGLLTEELTVRQAADRLTPAVFGLHLYETQRDVDDKEPTATASGFFITGDGRAVTNYHSIENTVRAVAVLADGQQYEVESVLYYDPAIDIAVLQIAKTSVERKTVSAFPFLETASSDTLRGGDTVYTLGNPLGLGLAVSSGVVSATGRVVERYQLPCIMSTADISQGSSGGALLNVYGQAVGVTSGAFLYGNSMYLAVPIDPVLTADLTGPGLTLTQVAQKEAK